MRNKFITDVTGNRSPPRDTTSVQCHENLVTVTQGLHDTLMTIVTMILINTQNFTQSTSESHLTRLLIIVKVFLLFDNDRFRMEQDTVKSIKKELLSNERKLEESMSHTREISKLISVIEKAIEAKEGEISGLKSRLSLTKDTLGRTEKELVESKTSARKRGDDVDRLQGQLASERTEVRLLKSQLETANKQLSGLHSDLSETRATAWRRKEELDSLNSQVRTGGRSGSVLR